MNVYAVKVNVLDTFTSKYQLTVDFAMSMISIVAFIAVQYLMKN